MDKAKKDIQYYKFCFYGFLKNLRFFESFIILFFLQKNLSFVEIGFLYSIKEITTFVFEIPSGVVADALGRRRTMIMALLTYILSFVIFYFAGSYFVFALAMIIFAFAEAFRSGVNKAMIFNYLQRNGWEDQKADYYGNTRACSQKGSAISALTAAVFVFYSGNYNIIFIASIIPYLINVILLMSYPKWLDGDLKNITTISIGDKFREVERAFVQTFKKALFVRILVSSTLYTGYYKAVKDYIQPLIKSLALAVPFLTYLNDEKKTAVFIGIFYFITYLMTSRMSKSSGKFLNRFKDFGKPMNLTIIIGFLFGVISGGVYILGWYFLAVAGFVFILLIENLRKPIGVALVADVSHDNAMATVLSLSSQVKSVFAAVIAPLIGFIADKEGLGAGLVFTSLLLILFYPLYRLNSQALKKNING